MSSSTSSLSTSKPKDLRPFDEYNHFLTMTKKNIEAIYEAKIDKDFTHAKRLFNIENLQADCALKAKEIFSSLAKVDDTLRKKLNPFEELACQLTQLAENTDTILHQFHFGQLDKLLPIKGQSPSFVQFNPVNLTIPTLTQAQYLRRFLLLELTVDATIPCAETITEYETGTQELRSAQLTAAKLLNDAKDSNFSEASKAGEVCAKVLSKKVSAKLNLLKLYFLSKNKSEAASRPEDLFPEKKISEPAAKLKK